MSREAELFTVAISEFTQRRDNDWESINHFMFGNLPRREYFEWCDVGGWNDLSNDYIIEKEAREVEKVLSERRNK